MSAGKVSQTPGQTIGPFFAYCLTPEPYGKAGIATNVLTATNTEGEAIRINGRLLDGAGAPISDSLIEIWQANAAGRYNHPADNRKEVALEPGFTGFGRCMTDEDGRFSFDTIKPGRVPGLGNRLQAPHIGLIIQARGVQSHVYGRLYFSDEQDANGEDPVLSTVEKSRRGTLIARREDSGSAAVYHFDIHMQGADETVFFDA
jgi:protocatechuate 3,4-dioxygenase alpha subunit